MEAPPDTDGSGCGCSLRRWDATDILGVLVLVILFMLLAVAVNEWWWRRTHKPPPSDRLADARPLVSRMLLQARHAPRRAASALAAAAADADGSVADGSAAAGWDAWGALDADPIDAVITCVDGSDGAWKARFRHAMVSEEGYGEADVRGRAPAARPRALRYDEEVFYNVLGILRNAPWIRTVWIVMQDPQRPQQLAEMRQAAADLTGGRTAVQVVPHSAILRGDQRPTFNSYCITSNVWRIPGLSERFVFFNDDFFVNRPVSPDWFFDNRGYGSVEEMRAALAARPPDALGAGRRPVFPLRRSAARWVGWERARCALGGCGVWRNIIVNTADLARALPDGTDDFVMATHQALPFTKTLLRTVARDEAARAAAAAQAAGGTADGSAAVGAADDARDHWAFACGHKARSRRDICISHAVINGATSLVVREPLQRCTMHFRGGFRAGDALPTEHLFCVNSAADPRALYRALEARFVGGDGSGTGAEAVAGSGATDPLWRLGVDKRMMPMAPTAPTAASVDSSTPPTLLVVRSTAGADVVPSVAAALGSHSQAHASLRLRILAMDGLEDRGARAALMNAAEADPRVEAAHALRRGERAPRLADALRVSLDEFAALGGRRVLVAADAVAALRDIKTAAAAAGVRVERVRAAAADADADAWWAWWRDAALSDDSA